MLLLDSLNIHLFKDNFDTPMGLRLLIDNLDTFLTIALNHEYVTIG